jgi:uncharacterized RDD family membrane protein YckC
VAASPTDAQALHEDYRGLAHEDYAGLATRTIAFGVDAAAINGAALATGVLVGLGLSVLHLPQAAETAFAIAGGACYLLWTFAYFVTFWSTTGQTPGDRLMRIRVLDGRGDGPLGTARAALRLVALMLGIIPLLAGVWVMLWDRRRQGFHDRVARTVVVYEAPVAQVPTHVRG